MKKIAVFILAVAVGVTLIWLLLSPRFDTPRHRGPSLRPDIDVRLHALERICSIHETEADYAGGLPSPEYIAQEGFIFSLDSHQPLREHGTYVLRVRERMGDALFLYSPELPIAFPGEEYRYIFACNAAYQVDGDNYIAIDSRDYRDYWAVVSAPQSGFRRQHIMVSTMRSAMPPFPGCFLGPDGKLYYPENLLPAVNIYYPDLQVPEEYILRDR